MEMNQSILKEDVEIFLINHILRSDVRGSLLEREDHQTFNQHLTTECKLYLCMYENSDIV